MAKAYSLDLRRKVFTAWQEGEQSQATVGARFGVSESFVGDLAALHRQTGDLAARPRGGGRRSLATPAALAHLGGLAEVNDDHTIAEHHQGMRAVGFALGEATVGRMLLRLRHTQKKTLKNDEASSERVKRLRAEWPEQTAGIRPGDYVFIDESGVNRAMTRLRATGATM